MAIDFDDAMRSGAVSMKAAKKHGTGKHAGYGPQPGVKGPKAKGSMPMATHKQEGALSAGGAVSLKRLPNASEYQKGGRPTKGGGVTGSNVPGRNHIKHYPNKKAFPAGAKLTTSQREVGSRTKGTIPPSGGMYGGGGQKTQ